MLNKIMPEVSHPTPCCPNPEAWSCYDSESTELEVLAMLTSLVMMLKPRTLIETGCYRGFGTAAIARGVLANRWGDFYTTDIGMDMVALTRERLLDHGLLPFVDVRHGTGLQLIADVQEPIDFAFLDSGPDDMRCHELRAVLPKLAPSGVVVIHDTGMQHGLREHFLKTMNELKVMYFMFDTPRGLSLVRNAWTT